MRAIRYEEIDDEVFFANMDRSQFTSGMKVMKYLEIHANEVLETAAINADPAARGKQGGRGKKAVSRESSFSAKAISARLGVSENDVLAGVELLRCRLEKSPHKIVAVYAPEGG